MILLLRASRAQEYTVLFTNTKHLTNMATSNKFLRNSAFILFLTSAFLAVTFWDSYQTCTSTIGELARALDPDVDSQCKNTINRFYQFSGLSLFGRARASALNE